MPTIKCKSTLQLPEKGGYMAYISIPAEVYSRFTGKKPPRIVITVNKTVQWKGAIMSLGNGNGFVSVSKKSIKEHGWKPGQPLDIQLEDDTDEETFPLPEEMVVILETDDEAREYYNALTDGKKRSITVYINQTKNAQLRVDRALMIAENLKRLKGKASVMQLMKTKKDY
jgi:Bacteriocin-protection, YdeI or OmpD-Associated/Domain of unknown function (DUF1905)